MELIGEVFLSTWAFSCYPRQSFNNLRREIKQVQLSFARDCTIESTRVAQHPSESSIFEHPYVNKFNDA